MEPTKDFDDLKILPDNVNHFATNHVKSGSVVFDSSNLVYTNIRFYTQKIICLLDIH